MQQFIAPRVLIVNGQPAPCECCDGIVCAYCTQANLVLWDRQQQSEKETHKKLIHSIQQKGVRKTARLLKIRPNTVSHWIKNKNIPSKYIEILNGVTS
jgi:hypothetical protein